VRDRDVAGRHGGFIAEGEVVLRVLARSRLHSARSVLVAERHIERLTDVLGAFASDVTQFAASQAVMDRITGFHIHRGILAFGERSQEQQADDLIGSLKGPAIVIVLFGVANHDNVGGVFRNSAAFGVSAVLLDAACCDPLYRKAIRVSVGGALITPFACLAAGLDPLVLLARHDFEALALSPKGATALAGLAPPRRAALLIGSEGEGLPTNILDRASTVRIPMDGGFDSLNLATTSGIVLHHLRQGEPGRVQGTGTA
jgi:tRNA G18 (ribose-2'-O)-methylase SpoU